MPKVTPTRLKSFVDSKVAELNAAFETVDGLVPYDPDSMLSKAIATVLNEIQGQLATYKDLLEEFQEEETEKKDKEEELKKEESDELHLDILG